MRRSRSAFLRAMLAAMALFGVMTLSGWHNAIVHDHDDMQAMSVDHDHAPSKRTGPDAPIHVIAHATGQWVSVAAPFAVPMLVAYAKPDWSAFAGFPRSGIDPARLLRPPRG